MCVCMAMKNATRQPKSINEAHSPDTVRRSILAFLQQIPGSVKEGACGGASKQQRDAGKTRSTRAPDPGRKHPKLLLVALKCS